MGANVDEVCVDHGQGSEDVRLQDLEEHLALGLVLLLLLVCH